MATPASGRGVNFVLEFARAVQSATLQAWEGTLSSLTRTEEGARGGNCAEDEFFLGAATVSPGDSGRCFVYAKAWRLGRRQRHRFAVERAATYELSVCEHRESGGATALGGKTKSERGGATYDVDYRLGRCS